MLTQDQIGKLEIIEQEALAARRQLDVLCLQAAVILGVQPDNIWVSDMVGGGCDLVRMLEGMGRGGQLQYQTRR